MFVENLVSFVGSFMIVEYVFDVGNILFFVFIGLLYVDFFLCKIFLKKGVVLGVMFVVCVVLFLIWYLL